MPEPTRSPQLMRIILKIAQVEGLERARATVNECLSSIGVTDLRTEESRLRFAEALIRKGGFTAVVGRSMKIDLLLKPDK